MAAKIIVVEDEAPLVELLKYNLQSEGYDVVHAADGEEAELLLAEQSYDLAILDWMIPKISGIELCRRLRNRTETQNLPIILLTARGEESDRVRGLTTGADDYVTKPFSPRELLARIRANVRRVRGQAGPAPEIIQVGALALDTANMTVTLDGKPIEVTAYEFSILRALAQRPGKVLSREQLLDLAKGSADLSFDRSIDVHVSRLRAKLGDDSRNPKILKTVRGAGYMLAGGDS